MDQYNDIVYEKTIDVKKDKESFDWQKFVSANIKKMLMGSISFLISRLFIYHINPMAIAFYAIGYLDKSSRLWIFLGTVIGFATILPAMDFIKFFLILTLMMTIFTYVEIRGKKQLTLFSNAVIATASTIIISFATIYMQQDIKFWISFVLLEGILVLTLTFLYSKSVNYLLKYNPHRGLTNEQMISFGLLIATIIGGAANLQLMNYSLKETILFSSILYFGFRFGIGIGSIVGLLSGLILTALGMFDPVLCGAFGIIGFTAGLFREIGKLGSAIGFLLGTILLGYYYSPELLEFDMIKALISSIIIFLIMPKQWLEIDRTETSKAIVSNDYYKEKLQKITSDKLKNFANSFHKLSKTFTSIADKRIGLNQKEVNQIFDEVAEKVCKSCSMCALCWEKEFYDTYKASFSILSAAEKKGHIQNSDVPKEFVNKCIRIDDFVMTTNRLFELFKNNLSWHNKIVESRELVSEQLTGMANIIDKFTDELYANINTEKQIETEIENELKNLKIIYKDVMVVEKQNKRKEVLITIKAPEQHSICSKDIVPVINKILHKKMKLEEGSKLIIEQEYCTIKFIEERVFRSMQGIARTTKYGENVSGDNFSFFDLSNGQTILALSDGMGAGLKACKESETAVDLLEQLLEAGFDKQTAIKMINSVLVLKSNEYSFSTLDLTIIDMYTGLSEFIKIGAASTFIKRKDGVETIKSTSLPVGVLNKVDFDTSTKKLYEGDFIVMVTDGIVDADDKLIDKEKWIEEALTKINTKNPQEIADYILQKSVEKTNNNVKDDMTVLVSRIWKK
ncbi:MAG: stage II sporulation protein E [Eubacteriales bacterium]